MSLPPPTTAEDERALHDYLLSIVHFGIYGGNAPPTDMPASAMRAIKRQDAAPVLPATIFQPSDDEEEEQKSNDDVVEDDNEETPEQRRARKVAKKAQKKAKKAKKNAKKKKDIPALHVESESDDDADSVVTALDGLEEAPVSIGQVMEKAMEVAAAKRVHGPTLRQKELQEAILREQQAESADDPTEEVESAAQSEIDKVVAGLDALLLDEGRPKSAKMVVFLDLEWHTLDKKPPSEMVTGLEASIATSHICQICAISADYSVRFNQYISYRKLKEPWCRLVRDNVLEFSPQDDPQIALPVETVMEQFLAAFPADTLFLSFGTTDAISIFKTLGATHDYDLYNEKTEIPEGQRARREAVQAAMVAKEWRFGNVSHWMKQQSVKLNLGFDLRGSLGRRYDILFHHSLWLSYPTLSKLPGIVEAATATKVLREKLTTAFPSTDPAKFGLVPREWLHVPNNRTRAKEAHKNCLPQFWPTKHLEPVFHVAHTDTVMLINCVAVLFLAQNDLIAKVTSLLYDKAVNASRKRQEEEFRAIFKIPLVPTTAKDRKYDEKLTADWAGIENKQEESAYNSLATSVITETWFFRKYQLALSAQAEGELYAFYNENNVEGRGKKKTLFKWSRTAGELERQAYVLACTAAGFRPNKAGNNKISLHDEEYEVEKVVEFVVDNKYGGAGYWIRWKGHTEDDDKWLPLAELSGCKDLIDAYLNGPNKLTVAQLAEIRLNKWDQPPLDPPEPKQKKKKANSAPASQAILDRELQEITKREEREAAEEDEFENTSNYKTNYFSLLQPNPTNPKKQYHQLVMTRRSGKFQDKVKAIRAFLIKEALGSNDEFLLGSLVQTEHPFHEKRKLRFPNDPVKRYDGLPWFSFKTSVAEPRTEMLHTLMCRLMSDPDSVERTPRNFADFDVTLWEFDLIVKARIFLNTRFRFCKECKEYANVADLTESEDDVVNALAGNLLAAHLTPPPPPLRTPAIAVPAAAPTPASSVASATSSTRKSRNTLQTLTRPPPHQTPLTPLVSYFALRSSVISR